MNLRRAVVTAIRNPGMPTAYFRWILYRIFTLRGPYIRVGGGARIGRKWIRFSEYWSYLGLGPGPGPSISQPTRALISSCLLRAGEKSVAVDVGANIGIFSTAFAAAGFSEVHAFEPIPATFARLEENVEFNCFGSRVKLNAQGLGDQERVAEMKYDQGNPAEAHIVTETTPGACPIKITTLDRYAELNQIRRIDFLKIDTEGYETAVLRGAETLLRERRVSLILLEWYPELLIRAGSGPDELWRTIMDAGYVLHLNFSAGKTDTPVTFDELKSMPWSNLIAVPAEDMA